MVCVTISCCVPVWKTARLNSPRSSLRVLMPASRLWLVAACRAKLSHGQAVRPIGQLVQRRRLVAAPGRAVQMQLFAERGRSSPAPASSAGTKSGRCRRDSCRRCSGRSTRTGRCCAAAGLQVPALGELPGGLHVFVDVPDPDCSRRGARRPARRAWCRRSSDSRGGSSSSQSYATPPTSVSGWSPSRVFTVQRRSVAAVAAAERNHAAGIEPDWPASPLEWPGTARCCAGLRRRARGSNSRRRAGARR